MFINKDQNPPLGKDERVVGVDFDFSLLPLSGSTSPERDKLKKKNTGSRIFHFLVFSLFFFSLSPDRESSKGLIKARYGFNLQ